MWLISLVLSFQLAAADPPFSAEVVDLGPSLECLKGRFDEHAAKFIGKATAFVKIREENVREIVLVEGKGRTVSASAISLRGVDIFSMLPQETPAAELAQACSRVPFRVQSTDSLQVPRLKALYRRLLRTKVPLVLEEHYQIHAPFYQFTSRQGASLVHVEWQGQSEPKEDPHLAFAELSRILLDLLAKEEGGSD